MTVPDLKVDTEELREAGAALRVVAEELVNADARSQEAASYLGHPGLAAAIFAFAQRRPSRRQPPVPAAPRG